VLEQDSGTVSVRLLHTIHEMLAGLGEEASRFLVFDVGHTDMRTYIL
jgi:hypothetical protein